MWLLLGRHRGGPSRITREVVVVVMGQRSKKWKSLASLRVSFSSGRTPPAPQTPSTTPTTTTTTTPLSASGAIPKATPPLPQNPSDGASLSIGKSLVELSKLRLSALVVATSSAGFWAAGGPVSWSTWTACCVGTALCSSSASAWNQIGEVDRDARMKRTRQRPLVTQALSLPFAQAWGTATGVAGAALLAGGTNPVTTALGVGNIALYAGLYTHLKPRSEWNTWVGSVVGAVPPVMGWTAATGGDFGNVHVLLLSTTLYLWQFPHFFALSFMHRADYARGGFCMVATSPQDLVDGDRTARLITRYTLYLSAVPFLAAALDATSAMFAVEGACLNAYALYKARLFSQSRSNKHARGVFLTSLWYLPCWLMLYLFHSQTWNSSVENEREENVIRKWLQGPMLYLREAGRQLCLHEVLAYYPWSTNEEENKETANATLGGPAACPVVVTKAKASHAATAVAETTAATTSTAAAAAAATKTKTTE